MVKIKRALISVSDKSNLDKLAEFLHARGVKIISTGGTAGFIEKLGIPVTGISEVTKFPEMMNGRVKTLHPNVHGALLARRDDPEHMKQARDLGIELIDMVVVNLYPFEKTVADPKVGRKEAIENIDIGGPSMLRSAAKNADSVAVICDPQQYGRVIAEMESRDGSLSEETCRELAAEVFERTSAYDAAIAEYLKNEKSKSVPLPEAKVSLPGELFDYKKVQDLRYGENPHQAAAFYKACSGGTVSVAGAEQLHGKELSFNNILDLDAALNLIGEFAAPAAVIVKHTNPCGAAAGGSLADAYSRALACDPLSAFGGIIGVNAVVDEETAKAIIDSGFKECIIAPGFSDAALEILKAKKNLRLMQSPGIAGTVAARETEWDFKKVNGGMLLQTKDSKPLKDEELKTVSKRKPTDKELNALLFAWKVVKHVRSNAIVLAKEARTVGIGAGQMSRVDSVIISVRKAGSEAAGSVLASDAFFPKEDAVEQAHAAGITAIIQPGGSIKDKDIIAVADRCGMAMIFTGTRHFKH